MALTIARTKEEVETRLREPGLTIVGFFGAFSEKANEALPAFMDFAKRVDPIVTYLVDVGVVKGLHKALDVSSVPTVVVLEDGRTIRRVSGAQSADYYERSLLPLAHLPSAKEGESARPKRVVLYSSDSCHWCVKIKSYLRANKVRFKEINVSKDPSAAEALVRRSGQRGVPQVDIEGQIVVGFDRERINTLLGLKASVEA